MAGAAALVIAGVFALKLLRAPAYPEGAARISEISTDRAMYTPGQTVTLNVTLSNGGAQALSGLTLCAQATHLGTDAGEAQEVRIAALPVGESSYALSWMPPEADFQGYLLDVTLRDGRGGTLDHATSAVDVSSSWLKFPRYGYVCDFSADADAAAKIEAMNAWHINAIEYYDWQYRHHQPLAPGSTRENPGTWQDWAGRRISGQTVQSSLAAAKERGMVSMAYNMIYAATDSFFRENPQAEAWKLHFAPGSSRGSGEFKFNMGASPSGDGTLYFINPLNVLWQEHIFAEENKIFTVFDFDGWHADTVGDWGDMVTADGEPLGQDSRGEAVTSVLDTYTPFLNAAKAALGGKYLTFNPVGAQGIENANKSNVDALYAEFWPWDSDRNGRSYDTYAALAAEVEQSRLDSLETSADGKGKSLTVKAYINYDLKNGKMNDPAVLLCEAAVFAAGGARLEIGNGDHMLHTEYYPDDGVLMSDALKARTRAMYDFMVAYENLLRDGQSTVTRQVEIKGVQTSVKGASDAVWTYNRADENYEILHLINLVGTDSRWRDEDGKKAAPEPQSELRVRCQIQGEAQAVTLASPDEGGRSTQLAFANGRDGGQAYVEFTVPSLECWDMIYIKIK